MAVSQIDYRIQGTAQDRGTLSNNVLQRALTCGEGQSDGYAMIDVLPDDVLLVVFDAHRIRQSGISDCRGWRWDRLVHVCRRWRQIIFASPLRLCIHLRCTNGILVKNFLGCWPAFPIIVYYTHRKDIFAPMINPDDEHYSILAALGHSDRVHYLHLHIRESRLAKLATVLQKPFPMLKKLWFSRKSWPELVLPRGFLGGSAPRLQELHLEGVHLPELPKFLLSTRDLVTLHLSRIPPEGYISPETLVTCLAPLSRLTSLSISFAQHNFPSDQLDPAPVPRTRTVLPALTSMEIYCVIHYVGDFVARIDCPRLNSFDLYHLGPSVDCQVSQISKFVNRSEDPLLTSFDWVDVDVRPDHIGLRASHRHPYYIAIFISLEGESFQLSHVFQVISQFSTLLSNVRHFSVDFLGRILERTPTNLDLAQFLVAFSALQTVDLYGDHKCIAPALEGIDGEMAAGLLPALDLLYIEGRPVSSVDKFCTARRLSGHPVTVVKTHREFMERRKKYR
jgi:hypothetical protein